MPWIWTAIALNVLSAAFLLHRNAKPRIWWLDVGCITAFIGIWIEKGMGLIVPAFIPTPLGEIVEYTPTLNETLICFGIWAFGLLIYTIFVRVTIPVLSGRLTYDRAPVSATQRVGPAEPPSDLVHGEVP